MSDSSSRFRISPSVHPPHPLYIFQWIDCKYLFLRECRWEEARHIFVLLDLLRVALWTFFLAHCLVLWDQLLWEHLFLERLLIIPFILLFSERLENIIHLLGLSFISFTGCSRRISRKSSKALSDQSSFLFGFFFLYLLVNVISSNVLILPLLMQTVTVDVVCVVTFIVQTYYFFFSFLLLGRWICGIPATSFCSLAIPLIFSFSIIVPGFFRCLICLFCWSNPFTVHLEGYWHFGRNHLI